MIAVSFTSLDSKTDVPRQKKQFLSINYSDERCLELKRCSSGDTSALYHFALCPIIFLNPIIASYFMWSLFFITTEQRIFKQMLH